MRRTETWVIDSSVAAKWYLHDEDLVDRAGALWERFREGEVRCAAPFLSRHEVASTLTNASKAQRITWDMASVELANYVAAGISASNDPVWLLEAAMNTSRRYPVSFYDAVYVAMAEGSGANLVTADKRMYRGLAGHVPFIVWLGDVEL
jgi:predicted nucleic acid-binding protein